MSNVLAIAATTQTLRSLLLNQMPVLDPDLADLEVTLQPPDVARKGISKAQLNLFLYQVLANAAWRNLNLPTQVRPGETASPPLALNLHYVLTAWGRGDSDIDATSHRVLAAAMSTLHDRGVLLRDDIRNALAGNDLADQVESLRVTPLAQSVEELSKLWTAFQTNYRVSAVYEAAVVLIDSQAAARAPLPVLRRGQHDRGVITRPAAGATLESVRYPRSQNAARLGEDVVLVGGQLGAAYAQVRFDNGYLAAPVAIAPRTGSDPGTLEVHLADAAEDPAAASRWVPGVYAVTLRVQPPDLSPPLASHGIALRLAPSITVSPSTAPAGALTLTITCLPGVRAGQQVSLLWNDTPVAWSPPAVAPGTVITTLTFAIPGTTPGTYTVRLRVDGVDSIPADFDGAVPAFAANQQVVVT
jgi:hypothetical protein